MVRQGCKTIWYIPKIWLGNIRTVPEINNSKVEIIKTDFRNLEKYKDKINGDDCYFCIGTTKKDTPDKNEYRRIEYDLPVNIALIAKKKFGKFFFLCFLYRC